MRGKWFVEQRFSAKSHDSKQNAQRKPPLVHGNNPTGGRFLYQVNNDALFFPCMFPIIKHMLTTREQDTLAFIERYLREHQKPPRLVDIGEGLDIKAMAHISRLLKALEQKGYIQRSRANRGIHLLKTSDQPLTGLSISMEPGELPVLGRIAAGSPIEAVSDDESIDINAMLAGQDHFVLKVEGQSMQDVGIMDQDWVVIRACQTARNHEIVAVMINGWETTLKRIQYIDEQTIRLIPENSTMDAMEYHPDQLAIQGVLVGQFRRY
ncbi:transcriptional repressor LexA [Marinicella sediminis]|uniref:Transcriptional repressor LexA n=2 Tax=Marinicella sediminis TaxID=1792834 RepID=A0ABV7J3H8_9GAMM